MKRPEGNHFLFWMKNSFAAWLQLSEFQSPFAETNIKTVYLTLLESLYKIV